MTPLLAVRDLKQHYPTRHGTVLAVDGVSFEIAAGETLGLAGESGCGKSTIGRTIMRLQEPTSGSIHFEGRDVSNLRGGELRALRRNMQMVFQDPYASLNPRARIGRIIEEPLIVHKLGDRRKRQERVSWLMDRVGLPRESASRYPNEFSGGQRQRVGIARALALNPKLVICDEAVSALDLSIKAQVINLLADIQKELGLAYLFISHDLGVIEHIADRVGIMYLGRLVEIAPAHRIWSRPLHPYTHALAAATPHMARAGRKRVGPLVQGDVPSPIHPPPGCHFHTRCPRATPLCKEVAPELVTAEAGHSVACHHPGEVLQTQLTKN